MIIKELFGTIDNNNIYAFTLENLYLKVKILNFGGIIQSLVVKEKNIDVVLGYETAESYKVDKKYFGAIIGRTVNCIKNAKLNFFGKEYSLSKNDGEDHLHGGVHGLSKKVWEYQIDNDSLILSALCTDKEDGYLGNLRVDVTYRLLENSLSIDCSAVCDMDTPFNITNHSYFNLNGSGNIFNHYFKLNCADKNNQLCSYKPLKKEYDENICISGEGFREISKSYSPLTNIELKVLSDMPYAQFYTSNELDKTIGKREYNRNDGFCIETQLNPYDVIDGKVYLEKNKVVKTKTSFVFNALSKNQFSTKTEMHPET